jgi:hypothetical protein
MNILKKLKLKMIKRFKEFIKEEVSGTEIPENPNFSYFGAAYGTAKSPNTINLHNTTVVSGGFGDDAGLYTEDDYNDIYIKFLGAGGNISELQDISGDIKFSTKTAEKNIDFMLDFLQER